jgi:hypothetical protein
MPKRGGDFLGTILRAGMRGLDNVREVVVETGKQGKIQLDLTLLRRRRRDILADLGAATAKLAEAGRIDEDSFPELGGLLSRLEVVDQEIAGAQEKAGGQRAADADANADADADEEYDR